MQHLDWDFSQDLSSAEHLVTGDGIRFTRSERAVLQALMAYQGRIWTRSALLDAVPGDNLDASDRSIDFLINRLRRKLRDPARHPRYIESRYGEGYRWIADNPTAATDTPAASDPIRARLRGNAIMSYCDRPQAERAVLQRDADSVLVLRLQGFFFFAAASRLLDEVQVAMDIPLAYLILEFRDVLGVDTTAVSCFARMVRLAREHECTLVLSGTRPIIDNRLRPLDVRRFASLDVALEWRETRILAAAEPDVPAEITLAACLAEEMDSAWAATILRYFKMFDAPADTHVIRAASHTRTMYFLERGTIEVLLDIDGVWARVSRVWPGTLFGEIGFHCGGPRTASLYTLEQCRVVCMTRAAVAGLEADFPRLANSLHRFLARRSACRLVFYNDLVVDLLRSVRV